MYSSSDVSMLPTCWQSMEQPACLGKKTEEVLLALSTLRPVAGRFDSLRSPKGYTAIVDYAHTRMPWKMC